ncbi:MAG: hypothetical protein AUH85_13960 [Chloroflexi bacterium 13_1_40CM_4_68_4]|nr:MAG: hypothetical protein AUH85_13960 [Chloroflexi bacterium 13_1_40CM_4_68_4]
MALIKAAARLILRARTSYIFEGPALCLGVPDIYLTRRELAAENGVPAASGANDTVVTASEFIEALGVREVTSVDIPGSEHSPDVIHDLNVPFPPELTERFGLVIDPGTTEHVFDLRSALTNVVRALRPRGVVIHFVPIYSYNGGYFSINPNVMHDFYEANGFTDIRSYVIMWDRYRPFRGRSRCYPYGPVMRARHALADADQWRYTPHLLFLARKRDARRDIAIPIQHEDHGSRTPRLAGRIVRRLLPAGVATYLIAFVRRQVQLRRTRAHSFWV